MLAVMALSALFAAQAVITVPAPAPAAEVKEVAYESLMEGRSDEAVRALEARLAEDPNDPAVLINLGTAYVRTGNRERAAMAFRAAMNSDTSYRLELADGRWIDSRQAARMGLEGLQGATFAAAGR